MINKVLGSVGCAICDHETTAKESMKGKAYYCCDNCGCQVFARNSQADIMLRKKIERVAVVDVVSPVSDVVAGQQNEKKEGGLMSWLNADD